MFLGLAVTFAGTVIVVLVGPCGTDGNRGDEGEGEDGGTFQHESFSEVRSKINAAAIGKFLFLA
jgi:hypothetical protein